MPLQSEERGARRPLVLKDLEGVSGWVSLSSAAAPPVSAEQGPQRVLESIAVPRTPLPQALPAVDVEVFARLMARVERLVPGQPLARRLSALEIAHERLRNELQELRHQVSALQQAATNETVWLASLEEHFVPLIAEIEAVTSAYARCVGAGCDVFTVIEGFDEEAECAVYGAEYDALHLLPDEPMDFTVVFEGVEDVTVQVPPDAKLIFTR